MDNPSQKDAVRNDNPLMIMYLPEFPGTRKKARRARATGRGGGGDRRFPKSWRLRTSFAGTRGAGCPSQAVCFLLRLSRSRRLRIAIVRTHFLLQAEGFVASIEYSQVRKGMVIVGKD